jgi:two-component system chemotaxis response regulator CheY
MNFLLIDDSPVIRKLLRRILMESALGADLILEAGDGQEALSVLHKETVHVILCDVNMPVMNGHQFLAEVRTQPALNHIPTLMITTEGSQESVIKAVQLGAKGYIRKPFMPAEVKQKVAVILQKLAA